MLRNLAIIIALLTGPALAEDMPPITEPAPLPEPPGLPESVQSGEAIEPEVTIIEGKEQTVEEYRVQGQLYMVKVTPKKGLPYYLMDHDGDGNLETRYSELGPPTMIPMWVLFSW